MASPSRAVDGRFLPAVFFAASDATGAGVAVAKGMTALLELISGVV
jgi:hypothetical protein